MLTFPRRTSKYIPNYDWSKGEWSMTPEEISRIFDEAEPYAERGDMEGYIKIVRKIPLPPNMALLMRDEDGKEALLEKGYNLADAEIAYGKDWLDNYMVDRDG